ncbi:hypothetical protein QAD02_017562 [Eretmocerus hayati]|uniref:Uncharacterized protein n=1 Tax=Eretmocerus hayati TaxID=131215 RepID=A0ACC2PEA2_9HYME|nr:hypothetical protein QAD02_017562 [Eretmocerus hayati]
MPRLKLSIGNGLLVNRVERLLYKFSEVGLLDTWDELSTQPPKSERDDPPKVDDDSGHEAIPLQDQLWPIFVVGCILSVIAFIGELIWKIFIERTKLGELTRAFYNYNIHGQTPVGRSSQIMRSGVMSTRMNNSTRIRQRSCPSRFRVPLATAPDNFQVGGMLM